MYPALVEAMGIVTLISKGKGQILLEKKAKFLHLLPSMSPVYLPIPEWAITVKKRLGYNFLGCRG